MQRRISPCGWIKVYLSNAHLIGLDALESKALLLILVQCFYWFLTQLSHEKNTRKKENSDWKWIRQVQHVPWCSEVWSVVASFSTLSWGFWGCLFCVGCLCEHSWFIIQRMALGLQSRFRGSVISSELKSNRQKYVQYFWQPGYCMILKE